MLLCVRDSGLHTQISELQGVSSSHGVSTSPLLRPPPLTRSPCQVCLWRMLFFLGEPPASLGAPVGCFISETDSGKLRGNCEFICRREIGEKGVESKEPERRGQKAKGNHICNSCCFASLPPFNPEHSEELGGGHVFDFNCIYQDSTERVLSFLCFSSCCLSVLLLILERGRTIDCCSTYPCIHWLLIGLCPDRMNPQPWCIRRRL